MSRRRRSRVRPAPWFETLEARQLLVGGLGQWPRVEALSLRTLGDDGRPQPVDSHRLAEVHPTSVCAERAFLRAEMAKVGEEWAALLAKDDAGHVGRAAFRAERAAFRAEWRALWHEWASAGSSHRSRHPTSQTTPPAKIGVRAKIGVSSYFWGGENMN
jgi:hypothetical protein